MPQFFGMENVPSHVLPCGGGQKSATPSVAPAPHTPKLHMPRKLEKSRICSRKRPCKTSIKSLNTPCRPIPIVLLLDLKSDAVLLIGARGGAHKTESLAPAGDPRTAGSEPQSAALVFAAQSYASGCRDPIPRLNVIYIYIHIHIYRCILYIYAFYIYIYTEYRWMYT